MVTPTTLGDHIGRRRPKTSRVRNGPLTTSKLKETMRLTNNQTAVLQEGFFDLGGGKKEHSG
jgi:hypothetical protein